MPRGVYVRTEEYKKHLSEVTKEAIGTGRSGNFGKSPSPETRMKKHFIFLGHTVSEETRMKIRIKNTGKRLGEDNSFFGKHHSKEVSDKIRESNRTRIVSEDTRAKISAGNRGKFVSAENKEKIRQWHENNTKGKPISEEVREKIKRARMKQVTPFRDTSIEVKLQNALITEGIIFEKHKSIMGQPDIFIEPCICIFCDGDYWHKRVEKIKRDKEVNEYLISRGYTVLRFWEKEINLDIENCLVRIYSVIEC